MPNEHAKVFLDHTQEELDRAYDQLFWAPHRDAIQAEIHEQCEAVRRSMPPRTERYGRSEVQLLDIFAPEAAAGVPVVVYLHGGAWLRGSRVDCAYPAPAVTRRGAALVVPEFDNVGVVSLPTMIDQCREAVEWTVRNAESFGADPERVYLAGHSSGAHLASCVLLGNSSLKGALLISGMYDLHAPLLSARSKYVRITPDELSAASAMRHLGRVNCPVAVAWSVGDSPEFRRQGQVLVAALQGMGRFAGGGEIFSANHFEQPRQLADPSSPLSRVLYALMKI